MIRDYYIAAIDSFGEIEILCYRLCPIPFTQFTLLHVSSKCKKRLDPTSWCIPTSHHITLEDCMKNGTNASLTRKQTNGKFIQTSTIVYICAARMELRKNSNSLSTVRPSLRHYYQ